MPLIACPDCGAEVSTTAAACPRCGRPMQDERPEQWSRGVAAFLSFLIPGAGSMYKGDLVLGGIWLVLTTLGYLFFILPGFLLHVAGIAVAASGDPRTPRPGVHPRGTKPSRAPAAPLAPPRPRSKLWTVAARVAAVVAVVCASSAAAVGWHADRLAVADGERFLPAAVGLGFAGAAAAGLAIVLWVIGRSGRG